MPSQVQPIRSELKFEVTEQLASEIKRYLGATLRRDTHCMDKNSSGYQVCSVYLDSPDAMLCEQTLEGKRNRYKLRIRVYDDHPLNPAFAEIKRREGQVIKKQRAAVDRVTAAAILAGERGAFVPMTDESSQSNQRARKEWLALTEFCRLRDAIDGAGRTYVTYLRDAYVSPDGMQWRATFDRNLQAHPYRIGEPITIPREGVSAASEQLVVFELKFTNRFPRWMQDLVRVFDLCPVSFPKYVNCAQLLGVDTNSPTPPAMQRIGTATQRAG